MLKKPEANEPLELIMLDWRRVEATARISTGITIDMREALHQLLVEH